MTRRGIQIQNCPNSPDNQSLFFQFLPCRQVYTQILFVQLQMVRPVMLRLKSLYKSDYLYPNFKPDGAYNMFMLQTLSQKKLSTNSRNVQIREITIYNKFYTHKKLSACMHIAYVSLAQTKMYNIPVCSTCVFTLLIQLIPLARISKINKSNAIGII